ncbi:MAG: hypothetical protein LBG67_03125 [Campylobacteraceae bacterium]|jgi:dTDP-glucose pyrophosphorylase|nr:hypothetical protein [Campylobacteraceae bacterium]
MNVMFLMGGIHTNKDNYPLYLTETNEKTILETQIKYILKTKPQQLIFCINEAEIKQFHADSAILQIDPTAKIVPIRAQTNGAICTALLGIEHIDNDNELILMATNDFMEDDSEEIVKKFRETNADVGVVSFDSIHPRYSFVKLCENGEPVEFAEKNPISKNALVSFYYFKHGKDFVECAKEVIRKDSPVNDNFYISQSLNEMILRHKKIVVHKILSDKFHPLKTEMQLEEYIYRYKEENKNR